MNIQLPNGEKHELDESISMQEKLKVVEGLTEEWMPIIKSNWNSNSVKYFLDTLTNYLVWHKEEEERGSEDKEVMSRSKLEQMNKFKKRSKTVNFTDLNAEQQELIFGERGTEQ